MDDAVELYFYHGGYAGVSAIEGGLTNVCGIAPESVLRRVGFQVDDLVAGVGRLERRLRPLCRTMPWVMTGPLLFSSRIRKPSQLRLYYAGDALGFVDPFTGSGILNALTTGSLAGVAAFRRVSAWEHYQACNKILARPFMVSAIFRRTLPSGWAERLTPARCSNLRALLHESKLTAA